LRSGHPEEQLEDTEEDDETELGNPACEYEGDDAGEGDSRVELGEDGRCGRGVSLTGVGPQNGGYAADFEGPLAGSIISRSSSVTFRCVAENPPEVTSGGMIIWPDHATQSGPRVVVWMMPSVSVVRPVM